jgi:hypothetical protein
MDPQSGHRSKSTRTTQTTPRHTPYYLMQLPTPKLVTYHQLVEFYPIEEFPLSTIIPYSPSHSLIEFNWTTAEDVLTHLLRHPYERYKLLNEAKTRSPNAPVTYRVRHPLLHRRLKINSFNTDYTFVKTIELLIIKLERKKGIRNPPLRQVIYHPPPFPALDPFLATPSSYPNSTIQSARTRDST